MPAPMDGLAIEPMYSLPAGCVLSLVTNDGHLAAVCTTVDGRPQVCWDGTCGEPFDRFMELRDGSPGVFASADGNHVAYAGVRGERGFVSRDGIDGRAWGDVSRSVPPAFDKSGKHLAYGARVDDGSYRLILDGEPIGTAEVAPVGAVFSPDGSRLAYVEMRGEGRNDVEFRVVLDRQPGEWFQGMRNAGGVMQFSPDGRRFAYQTIDGRGHSRWIVDGHPHREINDTRPMSIARFRGIGVIEPPLPARFSPDGRRFAYFADVVEKGVAILEDDRAGPLFKELSAPVFSPDSRHLAYAARTYADEAVLMYDGTELGRWTKSRGAIPVFSRDARRVAMTLETETGGFLRRGSTFTVVVDGDTHDALPGTDASAVPAFSDDGELFAVWVQGADGRTRLLLDGVDQKLEWSVASEIAFDQDGAPVYVADVGGSFTVVVGDRHGPLAEAVIDLRRLEEAFGRDPWGLPPFPFRVTAAGGVAWVGRFGDMHRPVLDDQVGPEFDLIAACQVDEQAVSWWAQTDETVYLLRRPLDTIASVS